MYVRIVLILTLVLAWSAEAAAQTHPLPPKPQATAQPAAQQPNPRPPVVVSKPNTPTAPAVAPSATAVQPPVIAAPSASAVPQEDPRLATARQMQDLARQMDVLMRLYQQQLAKLLQDPTVMTNPAMRARVGAVQGNGAPGAVRQLLVQSQELLRAMIQIINASGAQ